MFLEKAYTTEGRDFRRPPPQATRNEALVNLAGFVRRRLFSLETRMVALLVDLRPCKPSISSVEAVALNTSATWTRIFYAINRLQSS